MRVPSTGGHSGGLGESRLCRILTAAPRNFFRGCHLHLACSFCPDEVVSLVLVLSRRPLLLKGKEKEPLNGDSLEQKGKGTRPRRREIGD